MPSVDDTYIQHVCLYVCSSTPHFSRTSLHSCLSVLIHSSCWACGCMQIFIFNEMYAITVCAGIMKTVVNSNCLKRTSNKLELWQNQPPSPAMGCRTLLCQARCGPDNPAAPSISRVVTRWHLMLPHLLTKCFVVIWTLNSSQCHRTVADPLRDRIIQTFTISQMTRLRFLVVHSSIVSDWVIHAEWRNRHFCQATRSPRWVHTVYNCIVMYELPCLVLAFQPTVHARSKG